MKEHNIEQVESRMKELSQVLANLAKEDDFQEFFRIIHNPGWTTPAELKLVIALIEGLHAQATVLDKLKQGLLIGSRAVK